MLLSIAISYALALLLPWPGALAAGLGCGVRFRPRRFEVGAAACGVLAAAVGACDRMAPTTPATTERATFQGWIASRPERAGSRWRALLALESEAERLVVWSRWQPPPYGTQVRATGVRRAAHPARHFHARGESAALAASGAGAFLEVERFAVLPGTRGATARRAVLEPLRTAAQAAFARHLAPRECALLAALVVGIRDDVDAATQDSWRALGLAHILSISGMHVALVAGALLGWLGSPRRPSRALVLIAGIWIYAGLGGLGPTVLRAACMATWAAIAVCLGRTPRSVVGLGVAALGLALLAPERRHDLGFQLSCLATVGLVVWASPLLHVGQALSRRGRVGKLGGAAIVVCGAGIAAQLATLPLQLAHFGMVSWAAPLLNLIAVPLTDAALGLGLLAAPILTVNAACGRALTLIAGGLLHLTLRLTDAAHAALGGCVWLPVDSITIGCATMLSAALLAAGIALARPTPRFAWLYAIVAVAACGALTVRALHPAAPLWQLEAIDVGQGDALLLRVGSSAWLVDAGDRRPVDHGARVVLPHLRRAGVRRLRGLVLSHPHSDHIGGVPSLLAAIAVDTIYVAAVSRSDSAYTAFAAAASHVPMRALLPGARLRIAAQVDAEVLWPDSTAVAAGTNDRSLVLQVRGEGFPELFFLGDLEREGEAGLLHRVAAARAPRAACVVLKVGHHGSDTSSSPALLDHVRPDVAVISVGQGNRYGHPSRRTIAALDSIGCRVLRTDRGGAIRLVVRGTTLWIERPATSPSVAGSLLRPG